MQPAVVSALALGWVAILAVFYVYFPSGVGAVLVIGLFALFGGNFDKKEPQRIVQKTNVPKSSQSPNGVLKAVPVSKALPESESSRKPDILSQRKDEVEEKLPAKKTQPSKYVDSAGVSPGARAMAAAMKSRSTKSASKDFVILYGSQTGNAMEIAKNINSEATAQGLSPKLLAMNDMPLSRLATASVAIFVASSTGDGDPPENCLALFNSLRRKTLPADTLASLKYTVLGLGDSNYTRFMHVPRVFASRLKDTGATCFYPCAEADEVDGLEESVDKWVAGLWDPLKVTLSYSSSPSTTLSASEDPSQGPALASAEAELVGVPALQLSTLQLEWIDADSPEQVPQQSLASAVVSASSPFLAPVTEARYLTAEWSDRTVIHLQLDVSKAPGLTVDSVRPGDAIGVLPENNPALVDALLSRLQLDGSRVFRAVPGTTNPAHLPTAPLSLRQALLQRLDLTTAPRKSLLRTLAECSSAPADRITLLRLSSRGGRDEYKSKLQEPRVNLLQLLEMVPSCSPSATVLLEALPPLMPRFYSISSDPAAAAGAVKLDIAFSVVREAVGPASAVFSGVATTWMERLLDLQHSRSFFAQAAASSVALPVFLRPSADFHPPADLSCPLLMIGPGTGVAPFRGFLQERRRRVTSDENGSGAVGESWLAFGCRRRDEDFLYEEELQGFVRDGTLSHLLLAFSREQQAGSEGAQKVYVQHRLRERQQELGRLLQDPKLHVFVCGDGVSMAKDVHACLLDILSGVLGEKGLAVSHMNGMLEQKRYIRDIWS